MTRGEEKILSDYKCSVDAGRRTKGKTGVCGVTPPLLDRIKVPAFNYTLLYNGSIKSLDSFKDEIKYFCLVFSFSGGAVQRPERVFRVTY